MIFAGSPRLASRAASLAGEASSDTDLFTAMMDSLSACESKGIASLNARAASLLPSQQIPMRPILRAPRNV